MAWPEPEFEEGETLYDIDAIGGRNPMFFRGYKRDAVSVNFLRLFPDKVNFMKMGSVARDPLADLIRQQAARTR